MLSEIAQEINFKRKNEEAEIVESDFSNHTLKKNMFSMFFYKFIYKHYKI